LFDELSLDKFKTYNNENFANLFKNESVSGKQFCKYCSQNYLFIENDENDEDLKCENCKKEIEI
jgi:DNA-directed RNA polymerase subunit RPC12/RpoP